MQYQSFPEVKGGSQSLVKLKHLRLPDLTGKRFLDVGCNEGFFCGYALYDGAARVVGIDQSRVAIEKASIRFPEVEFLNQSWETLPEGPFDVITLLSALHYAEDQEALIRRLMGLLSDDGLLVLELGLAPGGKDSWVQVERSIDERLFPTRSKLASILADYAWKVIGHSVNQEGDPIQRYVVHVRKLKPYAYLLLENPGAGKTTIARNLFEKHKVPIVSGDKVYYQIANGKYDSVSGAFRALVQEHYTTQTIDKVTRAVFQQGFAGELVDLWVSQHGYQDFALDSYVPESERGTVRTLLADRGFFPVDLTWHTHSRLPSKDEVERKAEGFLSFLKKKSQSLGGRQVFQVKRCMPQAHNKRLVWHLDSPAAGETVTNNPKVKIAGWAILKDEPGTGYEVVFRSGSEEFVSAPKRLRPDVLNAVFGDAAKAPEYWREHPCGFSFSVPISAVEKGGELGLMIDGSYVPLAGLSVDKSKPAKEASLPRRIIRKLRRF